jgi:pimeloyl-ACP methyl ester carboxylesterase
MTIEGLQVAVDDGRLAAWRLGAADGAPQVLAIHGITATSRSWLAVAAALGERASLLAPDLRGRGASNPVGPPFGLDVHADDMLALLDCAGLERVVVAGHSLGAFIACRFALRYPERVTRLVLVDGGLPLPGFEAVDDPDAFIAAALGPAVERLRAEFPDRAAYREWWRDHPALAGSDVESELLDAYADFDLGGEPPRLRSSVNPLVVTADGRDLIGVGDAHRLSCDTVLLHAPLGMTGDPNPLQPAAAVADWVAGDHEHRRGVRIGRANHYTILMGRAGAAAVARAIATP